MLASQAQEVPIAVSRDGLQRGLSLCRKFFGASGVGRYARIENHRRTQRSETSADLLSLIL